MLKTSVAYTEIRKVKGDNIVPAEDVLAAEEPLEIRLEYNSGAGPLQKSVSITMRTPGNDMELATGFLFSEGIITSAGDIANIRHLNYGCQEGNGDNIIIAELAEGIVPDIQKLERHFYTTSSCGVCGKASIGAIRTITNKLSGPDELRVLATLLYSLPDKLRNSQDIFGDTGGLHASAIFDLGGNLLILREDVGRHNALDKVLGYLLSNGVKDIDNQILLLSGRASFELIQKAAMAGIKVVAAVGAPSSLAVQLAKEFDITLLGFLRDQRFNIYSGAQRIIV
ncbi:MAG: formate dehydrogenase accessory sulfurtransferase FdhD [Bacteroidetes bacterium]|nr:formate dehydrogenase accessory sulfurtransferase FdhD [Bacteroidota bacterium]